MLIDDVERIMRTQPGLSATQIAGALFGIDGYGERVRSACRALYLTGRIARTGQGRPGDPFRYFPAAENAARDSAAATRSEALPPPAERTRGARTGAAK